MLSRTPFAVALVLGGLVTSAGCNALLGNEVYDFVDGGDASTHLADATSPLDGGVLQEGQDATSEAAMMDNDGGGDETSGEAGCALSDIHTCGTCTNDCTQLSHVGTTGLGCTGGLCTYACAPGYADCADSGAGCATPLSSTSTCGGCGVSCSVPTPLCAPSDAGVYGCASGCSAGETVCSGTCANLMTDATHCGGCTTACPGSQTCKGGSCQCPTTGAPDLCGTACTTKQTDNANCGSCGHVCAGGETCQAGVCACPANQQNCNGTCVNVLGTDVNNCGACGTSCSKLPHVGTTGLACTAGTCSYQCAAGFADCGNTGTGCSTSLGSSTNCSGCGAGCSGATPVCSTSGSTYACTNGCASGQTNCSGTCTTPTNDPSNCGTCGKVCGSGEACQSGTCVCPSTANPNFCGSACTNTKTDNANCGACSHVCPSAQSCTAGTCACPISANPTLCGSTCTNTTSDSANCGTCAHACPAAETCQGGTCACPTTANPNLCGTACTNTKTDGNNCGSCGNTCGGGQQCVNGSCACPSGTINCGGTCQTANKCGGCGTLAGAPGTACGTCGTYACNAAGTAVTCNDPGTTNSCPTWCSSQSAPSGIAASDYQCIDFDNGLPPSSTWSPTLGNKGSLSRSTAAFDSSPASLSLGVSAISDSSMPDTATLSWNDVGSTSITSVTISAAIDPTTIISLGTSWTGAINLMCLTAGDNDVCLLYTYGNSFDFSSSYVGLYVEMVFSGGIGLAKDCPVSANLTTNIWNAVQLSATSAGNVQVTVNGSTTTCSGYNFDPGMTANVAVGLVTSGGTAVPWGAYYDNVQTWVGR